MIGTTLVTLQFLHDSNAKRALQLKHELTFESNRGC